MMRLPPFKYIGVRSLEEAVQALADYGSQAMPVAGGTDLYPKMKRRQFEPKVLVGLRRLPELRCISGDGARGMAIGAGITLTEVSSDRRIIESYPALAEAAGLVCMPQIRNMGTIGGNLCVDTRCNYYDQSYFWRKAIGFCLKKEGSLCLVAPGGDRCWAVSSSDAAPVAIAIGARVRLVGPEGERTLDAADLYRNDGINYLTKRPDEILTEILLPEADGLRTAYEKLRRRDAFDFPVLGVAVALALDGERCRSARIVLGAVAPQPLRAERAEKLLEGEKITPELIEAAAEAAANQARPLDNTDFLYYYRKKMVRVYTARALSRAAKRRIR